MCKHGGSIPKPGNAHLLTLAGIHIAGSDVRSNRSKEFKKKVARARNDMYTSG